MTDAAIGGEADRVDAASERHLPSRHRPVEPGLLAAGVYSSRPLDSLRDAVYGTLESPSREQVRRGVDTGPLWRNPVLRGRLVQAVAAHADGCGAGTIGAADPDVVPLASAVAERLSLPMERAAADEAGQGDVDPAPYLVARVLHDREEGRFLSDRGQGGGHLPGRSAGAAALFRISSTRADRSNTYKIMYIIDL